MNESRLRTAAPVLGRPAAVLGAISLGMAGLAAPAAAGTQEPPGEPPGEAVTVDVLAFNDFHGRLEAGGQSAGAAVLAGAADAFRAENEDTVLVSAGDNIGASTFVSMVQDDVPTLEALNSMDLFASAVGNHEFDRGAEDLTGRVTDLAEFPYLAANITGDLPDIEEYAVWESPSGVSVGFIGVVTPDVPSLVTPAGIAGLEFTDMSQAANRVAAQLSDGDAANGEADVVVVLAHEGAAGADVGSATGDSGFGALVNNAENIDAVVSGHTHQLYAHDVDGLLVTQASQYGEYLTNLSFDVDPATGEVLASSAENVDLVEQVMEGDEEVDVPAFEPNAAVAEIVADAVAEAERLGAEPLGEVTADLNRARNSDGSENRGGESTLGNLVADVQLWATQDLGSQIAFMNPGGLREDITYAGESETNTDGVVTYEEAAVVQPFANTLNTMELTGAQVVQVLEEQWQPEGASRPFLKLGVSEGFAYTYDPDAPAGERILTATLNGEPLDPEAAYTVTVNSFLASGGDNFTTFAEGADNSDSGRIDLQAFVDYLAEFSPVSPPTAQRAVGVSIDGEVTPGAEVTVELSSLAFSAGEDQPSTVTLSLDGQELGSADVETTVVDGTDEVGQATVSVTLPADLAAGPQPLTVTTDTGTEVTHLLQVADGGGAAGGDVVINEVFARGGSANQPYTHKFVELYNPTDEPVDLEGMSVQYRSAGGTAETHGVAVLSGTIEPGGYYLVQGGSNGDTGQALPAPDAEGNLNLQGSNGTVALVEATTAVTLPTGDVVGADGAEAVVDLVGYGSSNTWEGSGPAATSGGNSDPQALTRTDGTDSDDNAADLTTTDTPTPQNSGGQGGEPDPGDPQEVTIAEIQGTGETTPLLGQRVTTRGVVTAAYPTGGLDGIYLQTPGTGGDVGEASHGIFVYSAALAEAVEVGDHLAVTGTAGEYHELTQLADPEWTVLEEDAEPVQPAEVAYPATDAEREALEGMLVAPQGDYTVTDTYPTNRYGTVGLAAGDEPLVQPSEVANPRTAPEEFAAVEADNAARGVVLDDGATWDYTNFDRDYHETPVPYLSLENPVRVGADVTFTAPVVLDYRYESWTFQPTTQVTGDNDAAPAEFENTREGKPEDVGGDIQLATFNVLNYFTALGVDEPECAYYPDRHGEPTTTNWCEVRGAYDAENLERQEAKIVAAITRLGAEVVALEEIENSRYFTADGDRDQALAALVDALNEAQRKGEWAYVESPEDVPEDEDVIRNAFIYRADRVTPVGASEILLGSEAFDNAREPLAQLFRALNPGGKAKGPAFAVVTNHFKSKGSGEGEGNETDEGQGLSNADRVAQAQALVEFADDLYRDRVPVFLVGDFNAYTAEDPLMVLEEAGYTNLGQTLTEEDTYSYDGRVGSLDHIFGDAEAAELVTGADIWNINSVESIGLEYSRYNYNVTDLYDRSPFRSSDHDPLLVGLDVLPGKAPDHAWGGKHGHRGGKGRPDHGGDRGHHADQPWDRGDRDKRHHARGHGHHHVWLR